MSKIFKKNNINVNGDNKVFIKHSVSEQNAILSTVDQDQNMPSSYEILQQAKNDANEIISNAKKQADKIMLDAKKESECIVNNTNKKQEEIIEKFKKIGYDEGYELGHKEGSVKGIEQSKKLEEEANDILLSAKEEKESIISSIEEDTVSLIAHIVDEITYGAFSLNSDMIILLIRRGMENATIQNKVTIKVSVKDYDTVIKNIDEINKLVDSTKEVEVLKDFTLLENDCVLETEFGNINCGLDVQLKSLKESLFFTLNN